MNILLDTNILLWAAADELPQEAIHYIEDSENTLMFSPASIWEVVIKHGLGRTDFIVDPNSLFRGLIRAGYSELPITGQHTLHIASLQPLHKDPFDRILLAQSSFEGIPLLTSDSTLMQYPGPLIHIRT